MPTPSLHRAIDRLTAIAHEARPDCVALMPRARTTPRPTPSTSDASAEFASLSVSRLDDRRSDRTRTRTSTGDASADFASLSLDDGPEAA